MVDLLGKASIATGVRRVALSGGVWQNITLLTKVLERGERTGLEILIHRQVPANDGGLALGQAVVGALRLRS
jgi:hydrogenase maturation protein HypF